MRPIKGLTGLARQIASTRDPSKRIPAPSADDEVGELARTMDGMLRALDEARSEREQALERQREFVADASHELRTPLTSIQANLDTLARNPSIPPEQQATILQEIAAQELSRLPEYRVEERGPDHMKEFTATVYLGGVERGRGTGRSKKEAEQRAAREAYESMQPGDEAAAGGA
jgi:signal transduction histidine kinase